MGHPLEIVFDVQIFRMSGYQGVARNVTLDFVKGVLVIVMVIYHSMNVFALVGPDAYGSIRFVSGSFIFISGYIIATFNTAKFQANRAHISQRLIVRGAKLFIVFTALNIVINLTGAGNPNKMQLGVQQYLSNLGAIYGPGDTRLASFQILLPISYLLIISPVILLLGDANRLLILACAIAILSAKILDVGSVNIELLTLGVIGLFAGMIVRGTERSFVIKNRLILAISLLVCLSLMAYMSRNDITYSIAVMIVLKLFYDLGANVNLGNPIAKAVILLGQYSLVCYISQIIFLQGLSRLLARQKWELGYEMLVIIMMTTVFLWALGTLATVMRQRYILIEKSYKFIFS